MLYNELDVELLQVAPCFLCVIRLVFLDKSGFEVTSPGMVTLAVIGSTILYV
jgi:hypothetical protein